MMNIDAQRRWWPEFDMERLIDDYAKDGFNGVKRCIEENIISDESKRGARAFVANFRRKHVTDPYSYPINWLVRNLLMHEFETSAPTPVGPKTRAHTLRVKAAEQELEEFENDN
jgi:hypothetical protein